MCGAGWAMGQLRGCVCGHGEGVSRGQKSARRTRAVAAVEAASPRARGNPTVCVFHTARRMLWSVCVQLVGPGKGRARRATLLRQAADHRMRSAAPVCVCVRAATEAGGGGARAFGDARRGASFVWAEVFTTPRQPRGRFSVNWPVRGRRPSTSAAGWRKMAFFWCAPPPWRATHPTSHPPPLPERPRGATSARASLCARR